MLIHILIISPYFGIQIHYANIGMQSFLLIRECLFYILLFKSMYSMIKEFEMERTTT